jgi:uncharacterized protein (DUF697 family)
MIRIRIGVVGVGLIARRQVRRLLRFGEVEGVVTTAAAHSAALGRPVALDGDGAGRAR